MGDIVDINFTCKNTGDKPLYLVYVRPSCGCTVADYTKEPIPPGKEGKIDAQFDFLIVNTILFLKLFQM